MKNELIATLASEQGLDRNTYWNTISKTVVPAGASNEQVIAFLAVANQYGLNPMTKEIYAFPTKGGGIQPIVSVDGWLKLANQHPQFDGLETAEVREGGEIIAITCTIHRKDRGHPTMATEYMAECQGQTGTWKRWPVRMLTNKAMIQAIRRAFSFAGIYDPDEGQRIAEAMEVSSEDPAGDDVAARLTTRLRDEVAARLTTRLSEAKLGPAALPDPVAIVEPEAIVEPVTVEVEPDESDTDDDFDAMDVEALDNYLRYAAGRLDLDENQRTAVVARLRSKTSVDAKRRAARALAVKIAGIKEVQE